MSMRSTVLRLGVSLGFMLGLAWWFNPTDVVGPLVGMRPGWVLLAVSISFVQIAVLAWRWRFTARHLGVELAFPVAWREYYLSIFLNQVLPGGVMGDVSRAWRHARSQHGESEQSGPAVRAVVFERLSAQMVMVVLAVVSLLALPVVLDRLPTPTFLMAGLVTTVVALAFVAWKRRRLSGGSRLGRMLTELSLSRYSGRVLILQLASAIFVVATYLATYLVASRAIGMEIPTLVLLPLVAPVLMTMLIPVTVAGWGLRESAAAVLWGAVGLTAADGVAVSLAYGLIVLLCSLPGAFVLLFKR